MDTLGDISFYVNEVLAEREYARVPESRVREAIGWGVHELLKILAPEFCADPKGLEEAVRIFKERYTAKPVRQTRAFPQVVETLQGPLKDVHKAIVTNKPHDITLRVLEELRLTHFFETVIGMNAGFEPKPDPDAILHLIKTFGVSAAETVYVGDSPVDAQASSAAGVDFAWVEYGYQALDAHRPRFCFSSAAQWDRLVSG